MEINLTVPALLFPALAILMLGYVNRYVSLAGVIRSFKKDYDSKYIHTNLLEQLKILKKRIELLKYVLLSAMIALILACLSMFFIFINMQDAGKIVLGLSLLVMIMSILISISETSLSNKSLIIEIDDIVMKEKNKS
ncbi:MAG: DUF2721 domain-containing protein [Patescibacteria group bacterium]|nr:DUF2721 domain-containing protein [Patescibacteria group bacterium]